MNKIVLYLNKMFKEIPYRITGIELGEHESILIFFFLSPFCLGISSLIILPINVVLACMYIGQSKKKFSGSGNVNLTYEQNCIIFKYVFDYIKCPKRFLIV
jgi:hypothetical protein